MEKYCILKEGKPPTSNHKSKFTLVSENAANVNISHVSQTSYVFILSVFKPNVNNRVRFSVINPYMCLEEC